MSFYKVCSRCGAHLDPKQRDCDGKEDTAQRDTSCPAAQPPITPPITLLVTPPVRIQ